MFEVSLFPKRRSYERLCLKFGTWLGQATNYGCWQRVRMNFRIWRRDFRPSFAPGVVLDYWRWRFEMRLPFCWFCTQDELQKQWEDRRGGFE